MRGSQNILYSKTKGKSAIGLKEVKAAKSARRRRNKKIQEELGTLLDLKEILSIKLSELEAVPEDRPIWYADIERFMFNKTKHDGDFHRQAMRSLSNKLNHISLHYNNSFNLRSSQAKILQQTFKEWIEEVEKSIEEKESSLNL